MLFNLCLDLAAELDRPQVYRELSSALDREEPKLIAMVEKPKKGLGRLPVMLDRKLKKYCKRVEDMVNEIHQGLAPLRGRRAAAAAPKPAPHREAAALTVATAKAVEITSQAAQTSPRPGAEPREGSTGSESGPLDVQDDLLYAPSRDSGAVGAPSAPPEEAPKCSTGGAESGVAASPRAGLRDISNVPSGQARDSTAKRPRPTGQRQRREEEKTQDQEEEGSGGPRAIAVLLSSCDCLEEDLRREDYLTYEVVDMVLSAGELVSKGWNDEDLLGKARDLFRMAALEGSIVASRCLGLFTATGIAGDGRDEAQARGWFDLGASKGDAVSTALLAEMQELGVGGDVDAAAAAENYSSVSALIARGQGAGDRPGPGSAALAADLLRHQGTTLQIFSAH